MEYELRLQSLPRGDSNTDVAIQSADCKHDTILNSLYHAALQPPTPTAHATRTVPLPADTQPLVPTTHPAKATSTTAAMQPADSALPELKTANNPAAMQLQAPSLPLVSGCERWKTTLLYPFTPLLIGCVPGFMHLQTRPPQ